MKFGWTKIGPVKVLKEDGNRVQVALPGRKATRWISKTHLLPIPRNLRLCRKAKFDQKCGCTSVVDILGNNVEKYNVYGKMSKYAASGVREGLDATPWLRRVYLQEKGFVRAIGSKRPTKNIGQEVFGCLSEGYRVFGPAKSSKPAKKKEAPVAAPIAVTPVAPVATPAPVPVPAPAQ